MEDDFLEEIERVKQKNRKKKGINQKLKGNRGELLIANLLTKHFKRTFRRVPHSGALVGGQNYNEDLREDATEILTSDIIAPPEFNWSLESKNYDKSAVHIYHFLLEKEYSVDTWYLKAKEDAERIKKEAMLIVKLGGKDWFLVVSIESWRKFMGEDSQPSNFFSDYLTYHSSACKTDLFLLDLKTALDVMSLDFWGLKDKNGN